MCENGCLTLPPILVMCVYSRVNEGSGTLPFRGCVCVCDARGHMVLMDLSFLDVLWLLCNKPREQLFPCQPAESWDSLFWLTCNEVLFVTFFSSLCVTLKLIVCRGVCDYCFLALKCSLYLSQMLVTESRFAPCPSCQTYAKLKACPNLRVVSLVAIGVSVVICG